MKIAFIRESEVVNLNPEIVKTTPLSATDTGFIYLAEELSAYHEVKIYCPTIKRKTYGSVEYIPIPSKKGIGCELHLSWYISEYKPDIVIAVGNPRFLMLSFLKKYRKLLWLHNHPLEMSKYNSFINKAGYNNEITIVTSSKEAMDYAIDYYHNKRILGIYNSVRKDFFGCVEPKEENKIIYVGPLSPAKGALEFLMAAKFLEQYKFYVCGSYDMYGYTTPGYKEACNLHRGDHIEHLGGVGAKDLSHHMASAQLCIVNPIEDNLETCCVSALESFAVGTPVLSGSGSLIDPIIKRGGLCFSGSLKKAIEDVMEGRIIAPNCENWVQHLDPHSVALEWLNLLESLLNPSI